MGPAFYFYCHPWDLEDEGIEFALGRLRGEIGVDAISVTAVASEVRLIRGRPLGGKRTFVCPSAAHFQPDSSIHRDNRIRPAPAAWMKARNPLERIARVSEREGLGLRVRVNCCEGRQLADRHPHAACVNVWGDPFGDRICPSQPDVRAYVAALMEDLSRNYPLSAIELSGNNFAGGWEPDWYEHAGRCGAGMQHIVSTWCFCTACRQRAEEQHIDADAVRSAILAGWDAMLPAKTPEADAAILGLRANPQVAAYEDFRREAVCALLRSARAKARRPLRVEVGLAGEFPGLDVARIRDCCDGLVVPVCEFEGEEVCAEEIARFGGTTKCDGRLICYPPFTEEGPSLVAQAHRAAGMGYAALGFEDYGLAPAPCLEWVRQAIRYAKRESGG